jgi:hypothetical protein
VSVSRRQIIIQAGAAIAATGLPGARGDAVAVDLALVLAIDISRSISEIEHRIQLEEYAAAFRSADVISAIASGANAAIAVTLREWANNSVAIQAVGWILLSDGSSAERLAALIETVPYQPEKGTSIGGAIISSANLLAQAPCQPMRRVIDVSGDGESRMNLLASYASTLGPRTKPGRCGGRHSFLTAAI